MMPIRLDPTATCALLLFLSMLVLFSGHSRCGPARRHVPDLCGPAPLQVPDLCQTQVPVPLPPALPFASQRRFEAYSRLRRGVYELH